MKKIFFYFQAKLHSTQSQFSSYDTHKMRKINKHVLLFYFINMNNVIYALNILKSEQ